MTKAKASVTSSVAKISYREASRTKASRAFAAELFRLRCVHKREGVHGYGPLIVDVISGNCVTTVVTVYLRLGPFNVNMTLVGRSKANHFVVNWSVGSTFSNVFPENFAATINGSRNQYDGAKATGCYESFEDAIKYTCKGLNALKGIGT